ncbi:anthranilate phosphoribosyltransferase [Sphingopyxis sp. QXT-31]|uniref:anthranilate phosphoribosyltransferase n=1 Tax=Sphingopyxis sp. QXT-31 TaxID=1357916 RepID=UPI000979106F|nr:anthranilate phosphoribosyltransferase [Sphingopyxis sp. QXT-31]APZ98387.1 anthranilate phosphoribosyltransferase [Sphingopyxis sp. QXT-31]
MSRFGPFPDPAQLLDHDEAAHAFATMLDGGGSDDDVAGFLTALSDRGETMVEIAAAAQAMRDRLIAIKAPAGAIDVCGTGGDGHHTLNVSTAVAIVVAACEVPVAKHGNRAASSKSGAADTLEALGLDMDRADRMAEAQLADLGISFLFAGTRHPAMKRIMPIRRAIGRRTIFNLMGPLANPARVTRQLVGIARPAYVAVYAEALHRLGTEHSRVISGDEGLDELSLAGGNEVAVVTPGGVVMQRSHAADAGLPTRPLADLRGGDAEFNAKALRALLQGERGAYRDAVLYNAAEALLVAGAVETRAEGAEEAAEAIDKGLANTLLDCWIAYK